VRRLSDPLAVRLLDVGALQAALQTLTASRQLASYNKLQGTIIRKTLKQRASAGKKKGHASNTEASEADYLTGMYEARACSCLVQRFLYHSPDHGIHRSVSWLHVISSCTSHGRNQCHVTTAEIQSGCFLEMLWT
jgi:hypothetical protein